MSEPQPDAPIDNGPRRDDLNYRVFQEQRLETRGSDVDLKNSDLHGMAPDSCPVALLIIDMINDMEFEGGDVLYEATRPLADRVLQLRSAATRWESQSSM
jgi:hypothetical protein